MPPKNGDEPATKAEMSVLISDVAVLKSDIKAVDAKVDRLVVYSIKTREDMVTKSEVAALETKMDRQFHRVFSALDTLLSERESNKRSFVVWDKIMQDQAAILANHENRITGLERRPAAQ